MSDNIPAVAVAIVVLSSVLIPGAVAAHQADAPADDDTATEEGVCIPAGVTEIGVVVNVSTENGTNASVGAGPSCPPPTLITLPPDSSNSGSDNGSDATPTPTPSPTPTAPSTGGSSTPAPTPEDEDSDPEETVIEGFTVTPTIVETEDPVEASVRVRNTRSGATDTIRLRLFVDDESVATERVTVAGGEETTVGFTHRFSAPGEYTVRISRAGGSESVSVVDADSSAAASTSTPTPTPGAADAAETATSTESATTEAAGFSMGAVAVGGIAITGSLGAAYLYRRL
jgi:hypothetical protein